MANIEKHAQARNVLLHISRQDGQIFLKIEDDGIGLPENLCQHQENATGYQSPSGHYGLRGMLERAKNAQGHLSIHPGNERGTSIEVTLPLVETPLGTPSPEKTPLALANEKQDNDIQQLMSSRLA